ncbi:MAG: class I SAM-dependent methyltransferase [Eubacterium sp.]|nr:class I SAM-dependent methyltransferase [Eubacterium sp.]
MNKTAWSIDTCELDEERISVAKKNIEEAGFGNQITIHEGDACDSLKKLIEDGRKFDLIFIDAAKAQYMDYINLSMKLSDKNATIITDNIFGDGDVLESHFLVDKRDRTIHDRMREYVYHITHSDELETALVPIGDGLAISIVNKEITEGDIR